MALSTGQVQKCHSRDLGHLGLENDTVGQFSMQNQTVWYVRKWVLKCASGKMDFDRLTLKLPNFPKYANSLILVSLQDILSEV